MRIQLDTDKKTIKLESEVLLSKLIETLDKLLPNGEWKKFTLETNTVINHWSNPIIIQDHHHHPIYPWYVQPSYTSPFSKTVEYMSKASDNTMMLKAGTYNVEL